jgi:hypothetical protein
VSPWIASSERGQEGCLIVLDLNAGFAAFVAMG